MQTTHLLAGVSLAFSFALAGSASAITIGFSQVGSEGDWRPAFSQSMKDVAAKRGIELKFSDAQGKEENQLKAVRSFIAQKVDAIVLNPYDKEGCAPAVEKAVAAHIPIVVVNAQVVNLDKANAYVGSDDIDAGKIEMQHIADLIKGKGNVAIMHGPNGNSAEVQRTQGNMEILKKYPEIKVVFEQTANWDRAQALSLMENWLQTGKQIDAVVAQNDEMALGAIEAVKAKGLDPKSIPTAGIDGVTDAVRAVQAGNMVSVLQDAAAQAQGGLDVLMRSIVGASYKPQSDIWTKYSAQGLQWGDGTAKHYNIPWTPITKENADAMLAERK